MKRTRITGGVAAFCLSGALSTAIEAAELSVPGDHATIQGAVDAAVSGDTINIAAGVYVEQTRILGKSLTLVGQPGTVLRAFADMDPAIPGDINWRCNLFIFKSSDVALRNLTFEGDQLADQNERGLIGAYFLDAGGSVENCRFSGFREKLPGSIPSVALQMLNDLAGARLLDVRAVGNTIVDSYAGIVIVGAPDRTSYEFTVADNTISGVGPISTEVNMDGITLGEGAEGEVVRNRISGFSYTGDGANRDAPLAFGVLALSTGFPENLVPLEPVRFEDNVLRGNQVHLALIFGDGGVVKNNRFEGSAPGVRPVGLWFSGENVQVAENDFVDLEEGVRLAGEDPDFGSILGLAANAQLTDNRFSGVAVPINSQPQATATDEGTMLAPFPEPALGVTRSVLLSWPGFYEGFFLEAAPASNGPWNPSDATPFLENGKHRVAVPADSSMQFFRLSKRQP